MKPIRSVLLFAVFVVSLAGVDAADPPTFSGAPPGMGEVQLVGEILVVSRGLPQSIYETRTATRKVGDKEEAYTYTVSRTVTMPSDEAVAAAGYRILDMQGQPVDRAVLAERLSKMTPVLISEESRRVDPQYLVLFKPGTLIVYLRHDRPRVHAAVPAPAPNAPAAPAPVPSKTSA
jgi:hypothetical protein